MKAAKEALMLLLKSLPLGCAFNIVSFGSTFEVLFPEASRSYGKETLDAALKLQSGMEADMGGTEILAPLKDVFGKPFHFEMSRRIFLLTDGGVENTAEVKMEVWFHCFYCPWKTVSCVMTENG